MKKYARLRPSNSDKFEEIDNILYNTRAEVSLDVDEYRPPHASASPRRNSPPDVPPKQRTDPYPSSFSSSSAGPSHADLTEALKKLATFREAGSNSSGRWQAAASGDNRSRSASGRWGNHAHEDVSGSGRWGTADSGSVSGRWGSMASTSDQWDDQPQQGGGLRTSYRDNLSISRSGRLMQEGESWSASGAAGSIAQSMQRKFPLRGDEGRMTAVAEVQRPREPSNISMRETHGWLASVRRPHPPGPRNPKTTSSLWEEDDPGEFNWKGASATPSAPARVPAAKKAAVTQSMRYDRLKTDFAADAFGDDDDLDDPRFAPSYHAQSVMQKAASMREGGAHSDAIMAMARAYSEKHGLPQAILECVSCGRGIGVILHGNLGSNDTSFCHSCCPPALSWSYPSSKLAADSSKSKRKGMMHYCRKILRMGKKTSTTTINKAKL